MKSWRYSRIFALALISFILFFPNSTERVSASDGVGTISGTVYGADGTTPIPDTLIVYESADNTISQPTCADANGHYEFQNVPLNQSVRLKSRSNLDVWCNTGEDYLLEYWPNTPNVDSASFITLTDASPTRSEINFSLTKGGSISGTVYEADTVTPISNIWVAAGAPGYYSGACTDANGNYTITPLPLGVAFQIQASTYGVNCGEWKDFVTEYWPQSATSGGAGYVTLIATNSDPADIDFSMDAGGAVSGTTYTADGTTVLPRIVVAVQNDSNTLNNGVCSDENGDYTLHGVPFDMPVRIQANASTDTWCATGGEYTTEFWEDTALQGNATYLTLTAGFSTIDEINFTMEEAGTISGTVYATNGVTFIPNALVSLFEDQHLQNMVTCTDANGNYTFHSVPINIAYRVQARSNEGDWCDTGEGYVPEYWPQVPNDWSATPLTLTSLSPTQSDIDFTLDLSGSISGTVYEADGITPISGIYVDVAGNSGHYASDCTDASGHYTLSALPLNVQFQVRASPVWANCSEWKDYVEEFWPETVDQNSAGAVAATAGNRDVTNINFTLDAGGAISGTVYKTDGVTPLQNIAVSFTTDDRRFHQSVCSDASGHYEIHGVPLNKPFRVRTDSYRDSWCDSGGDFTSEYWQESSTSPGATLLTLTELSPSQSNLNFTIDEAGSVSGTVYEADGITPIANVIVNIFSNTSFGISADCTDSSGHYTLHNVPFNVATYVYTDKGGNTWCGDAGNYALQFWPEKPDLEGATPLTVNQQDPDLQNIDFALNINPISDANIGTWYQDEVIRAYDWPLDAHLTLKIEDPNTPQFPDFVMETDVTDYAPWGPTEAVFDLNGQYDIQPGMLIFISDDTINRFMLVDHLTITNIDQDADTITGTADPNDGLWMYFAPSCCRGISVNGNGIWSVDYSVPGPDGEAIADIGPGSSGTINEGKGYGNTSVDWSIPAKTLHAVPDHPEVHGHDWVPGSTVTLTVDSDANLANGVLYTITKNVDDEPLWCGYPCFDLSGIVELQTGRYVTLSDGVNTKTVRISQLQVTTINVISNTISGMAAPGSRVAVNIWSQNGIARYVTATSTGTWTANFSVPGDEDFEQQLADIQPNDFGRAIQLNPDGSDDGTLQYWDVSLPVVTSSVRVDPNPTNAAKVHFTVTFSEPVTGVNAGDFFLTKIGVTGASIASVAGSGDTYTVAVNTGSSNGTIRLDVVDNDSIRNEFNIPLGGVGTGNGNYNIGEEYDVARAAPGIPVLLTPADGSLTTSLTPTLDWRDSSPAAEYYQLQVDDANTFATPILEETNLVPSTYTLPFDLLPGQRYYWRVRAFNLLGGGSAWSAVWTFRTPLAPPTLVSPVGGELLSTDRPTFTWTAVEGASQYRLQVSPADTFTTLLVNVTVNLTEYTATRDLLQNRTLFWRVQAKTSAVNGPWSQDETFVTGNPPSVPVLVSPTSGVLIRDYTPLFNWNNSTTPSLTTFKYYQIQVDDHSNFSSTEIDAFTPPGILSKSDFSPLDNLASNTKYYWRVRAINTVDGVEHISGWSAIWSFRTALAAPSNLSVIPNANPLRPTFDWNDATGPGTITNYTIQVSTNLNFSTLRVNATTNISSYTMLTNLPAGSTIYWRVRVNGANGPSPWTTVQFTTP